MENKENSGLYNLTNPQMNIFLREQHYNNNAINMISGYLRIDKKIEPELLNKMLNMLVEESDNMRIRIVKGEEDNKPYQYISEYYYREFPVIDFTKKSEKEAIKLIEKELQESFGLFEPELYQLKIYRLKRNINIISIKIHHIIADAWTFKLMGDRTLDNYSRIIKKQEDLKKYSYLEYIEKEKKYLKGESYQKDKEYWEKYLQNIREPAVLKDISLSQDVKSIRVEKKISVKIHKKIMNYCKKYRITPYTFFLSILSIYLYKTTGKEEFTIGTPLLNRKNFEEKNTGGMFISTIPLKVKIDESTTVSQLCSNFGKDVRKALRHQRYPYLDMLEFVRKNNKNFNKLFDVMLSFQNIKVGGTKDLPKAIHAWAYNNHQQTQFEFHISQYSEYQPFDLSFDFKVDISDEEERNLIVARIMNLIEIIVENENVNLKIDDINYIPLKEIKKLNKIMGATNFRTVKDTKRQNIKDLFESQVEKSPNKSAIKFKKDALTYRELNNKSNVLANKLIEKGVVAGDGVVILLDRSLEMAISILGIIKTGAHFIPVAIDWPYERIKYIVKDSKCKYIITEENFLKKDYCVENLDIKEMLKTKNTNIEIVKNKKICIKEKNLLYIIYTSGSTGNPKGVLITHKNVSKFLYGMQKMYKIETKDNWSMFHSYTFDVSMWEFFRFNINRRNVDNCSS